MSDATAPILKISRDLALPLDVVTEALGIVATRGAGKSYTSAVLIEETHAAGVPFVVLDPSGAYWGLRSSANGEKPGLAIYIFGGEHGDLPLEPTAGALMADLVVDSGHSFVLDVSDLTKAKARTFVADFLERLYERKARNRTVLQLVIDEADEFAPQLMRDKRGEAPRCLGAVETITKRGRRRGIGVVLITQRTQALNKDVLDLIETLIAMRQLAERSREAVKGWIADKQLRDDAGVIPEVPLFREPRRAKAARGSSLDGRFKNDYPPEWHCCTRCSGSGEVKIDSGPATFECADCLGMGSLKARVRLEAGHRCERCSHPYVPKGDAKMLGVEASWRDGGWSGCDELCRHDGPLRFRSRLPIPVGAADSPEPSYEVVEGRTQREMLDASGFATWDELLLVGVEAQWRILTVHHLSGDKADCRWWNLAALCQRCHLEIQAKVVLERVYPHEHSPWFQIHAAGWYAHIYLGEDLTREQTLGRLDELLDLERTT